jgi:ABC-2 type transport system permease protein
MAILTGYLFAPKEKPSSKIDVAVVDLDGSEASRALTEALSKEEALEVVSMGEAQAREQIEKGKLTAAVVLPEGFGDRLNITAMFEEDKPELPLLVDPSRAISFQLIEGLLTKVIMEQLGRTMSRRGSGIEQMKLALDSVDQWLETDVEKDRWRSFFSAGLEALETLPDDKPAGEEGEAVGGFQLPVTISKEKVVRKGGRFNVYAHSFAGMLVMFLFFVSIDGGVAVIDERRRGTWRRLRTAPIGRQTLLASKAVSTFFQGLFVAVVMYLFAILVFGVEVTGSLVGFVAILLMSAAVAAGFGLLLAALGRTEGQVRGYATCAVLLITFLGGGWFPHFMLPAWLQSVSQAVPTTWMMKGLYATTWRGLGLEAVWLPLAALLGFLLLFSVLGLRLFRWEE